ncbi:MAG: hypothetical protein CSB13_12145 [Chloroflexi bacterium]|nr:MAG: hypothetical protein CSB13_12145 [Chloroflexota bacterium]
MGSCAAVLRLGLLSLIYGCALSGKRVYHVTTISLQKYHEQINQLLDDSQYSLAADHCRYILRQHPRHVDTYRLLARILIEQGDLSGATELFQRVLSAEPNDFIAHAGLSVAYREEDVLSQAIWHLERAYEIEPYNDAIQQELKGLYLDYAERKARESHNDYVVDVPDSLLLTKGALARIYIQGELYTQAIEVLQQALAEEEDRIDLEVLLAEALWRDSQRVTAVKVCLQVLDKLPNCITANAVLAEIWLRTGRTEEAQDYLKALQALTLLDVSCQDLESPVGSAFQQEGALSLPERFEVERMDDDVPDGFEMAVSGDDSIVGSSGTDDYQWLEGLGDEFTTIDEDEPTAQPATMTDSDWLRRELESIEVLTEETAVSDLLSADWLTDLPDADKEDGLGTPEEMADRLPHDESPVSPAEDDSFDWLDDELAASGELTPLDVPEIDEDIDWLSADLATEPVPDDDEPLLAQIGKVEEAEEMPDWLADMSDDVLEPVQVDPSEAGTFMVDDKPDDAVAAETSADDDMYGWLDDIAAGEPADELTDGDLDLSQFAEFDEAEPVLEEAQGEEIVWRLTDELNPPEDETDVAELDEFDFEISPDDTGELEDVPDWLMVSGSLEEMDATSPIEEASSEVAEELAEWVAANQPEMDGSEALPDWLAGGKEGDAPAEISQEPAAENLSLAEPAVDPDSEQEEEDDFFTNDLPSWMVESNREFNESASLDSAPFDTAGDVADSAPLLEADLPDWLLSGGMDLDDASLSDTDDLDFEATDEEGELPGWLVDEVDRDETEEPLPAVADRTLPDWLSEDVAEEAEEDITEDDRSGTAVVGGMLGAAAAGILAKEVLDNDDENEDEQPVPPEQKSGLDAVVTEDAVSNMQDDDLIFPQDESEPPKEDSGEFDWLDDLGEPSAKSEEASLPLGDLSDDLDWINLDDDSPADDLNLDSLLGLEPEEEEPASATEEKLEEPALAGLAEDESLDWLDALAETETEAVDEMPTWKWDEDEDSIPLPVPDDAVMEEPVAPDAEALETAAAAETAVTDETAEDLDDAMSWLENLAAEPDAPVEELPSVAEGMDFDSEFDLDGFLEIDAEETAVPEQSTLEADTAQDVAGPPDDLEGAMAWLEQLAANQGAPLDELPSIKDKEEPAEAVDEDQADLVKGAAIADAAVSALSDLDKEEDTAAIDELAAVETEAAQTLSLDDTLADLDAGEPALDALLEDTDEATLLLEPDAEPLAEPEGEEMPWLAELEDKTDIAAETEVPEESEFGDLSDFDFSEPEPEAEPKVEEEVDPLLAELDWLESVTASPEAEAVYNAEELSVSDDDLANALENLTLLTMAGAAPAVRLPDDDGDEVEEEKELTDTETETEIEVEVETEAETEIEAEVEVETEAETETETETEIEAETETAVTEPDIVPQDVFSDSIVDDVPEDPDGVIAWIEELSARHEDTSLDKDTSLDDLPSVTEDESVIEDESEELTADEESQTLISPFDSSEEVDVEDAMAWLEQLAARQGTSLDELPTVTDIPEDTEDIKAPEWIAQQVESSEQVSPDIQIAETAQAEEPTDAEDDLSESLAEIANDDFFAALDEVPAIEGIETDAEQVAPSLADIDDSLPDWLDGEEGDASLEHASWLDTVEEPDMDGWLASEAEVSATAESTDSLPKAVETDSLLSMGGLEDTTGLSSSIQKRETGQLRLPTDLSAEDDDLTELDEVQALADLDLDDLGLGLDQTQLEAARTSLAGGDIESALTEYRNLVEAGEEMYTVISDLEKAVEQYQDQPMVRRMLGDAYMRNGQLNKAIETYRDALDQM